MTDAGLLGKASIDWDHLDATDSTGELGSLIQPCPTTGIPWSAAADEIFEVEEKLPADACVMVPRRRCIDGCGRSRQASRRGPRGATMIPVITLLAMTAVLVVEFGWL